MLLRGGTVIAGREAVFARRGRKAHLADGPGKLAQALGIDGSASGTSLWSGPVSISEPTNPAVAFGSTPRIGISKATQTLWRFVEQGPMEPASSTIPEP